MKKIIIIIIISLSISLVNAQRNPYVRYVAGTQPNPSLGIRIKDFDKLSVEALSKAKIPIIHGIKEKLNAKPLSSWNIEPLRPKNNWLAVDVFRGTLAKNYWGVESYPFFEGQRIAHWEPGFLDLKFRQSKGIEYRLKIKIMGTNHRGKALYVRVDDLSGRYPVGSDGNVNVVWRASYSTANGKIDIGHLLPKNFKFSDYKRGFPMTYIEKVTIDKI